MSNVLKVRSSGDSGKAPTIEHWSTVSVGSNYRLWGQVTGHPLGLDGDVMTSALFYLDPESGLARASSRWYRLGTPLRQKGMETYGTLVFGPNTASAIAATIGDGKQFKNGREFAVWLGHTPMNRSGGGRERLGRISKKGDRYL